MITSRDYLPSREAETALVDDLSEAGYASLVNELQRAVDTGRGLEAIVGVDVRAVPPHNMTLGIADTDPQVDDTLASGAHQPSHVGLIQRVPHYPPGRAVARLGGIFVPNARPIGSGLAVASWLATATDSQLIIARSGAASYRPFPAAFVPDTSLPTAVIDLPDGADRLLPWRTDEHFLATLHRDSDVGFKRNLGLLIGRMCGHEAMLFLDDDISTTPASQLAGLGGRRPSSGLGGSLRRLSDVLADFSTYPGLHAAGYFTRDMDDNSVLCHARRLVGRPQETFIGGGALAVRTGGPLPWFPRVYNEDWLFLGQLMLFEDVHTWPSSSVRYVGTIHQDSYHPFTVLRAQSEELGDLFAEGLFSLIGRMPFLELVRTGTSPRFWSSVIDRRCEMIDDILSDLYKRSRGARHGVVVDARRALHAASAIYTDSPTSLPEALAEFFRALLQDRQQWVQLLDSVTPRSPADALTLHEALSVLGLEKYVTFLGGGSHGRRDTDSKEQQVSELQQRVS